MNIGSVTIDPPVFLAPMAGITDSPFRSVARSLGCPAVFTEMVSAEGIVRGGKGSRELLGFTPEEHPIFAQIFGEDPKVLAEAARHCASLGFDGIDINMGCPVKKVVRGGAGAALMRDPGRACRILEAVQNAVPLPVTAKIRAGWSTQEINALDFARQLTAAGAKAITLHPRTRDQFYAGRADWPLIGKLASSVSVPVIGNGDLKLPEDAKRMMEETGCHGVMVGRAALGNPWLLAAMAGFSYPPSLEERLRLFSLHLEKSIAWFGSEQRAVLKMRKHLMWYSRGFPGAHVLRRRLGQIDTASAMLQSFSQLLSMPNVRSEKKEKQRERQEDDSRSIQREKSGE
jgi:tRNA-dihydrouridine synthase B